MVTIQTMIDHEDEDSDEVTPVPTVKAQVLEKIIQWIDYHKIDHEKTEKTSWCIQYFNVELKQKFEIIIGADYLEVKNLLNESCRNVLINNKWENIQVAAGSFHDPKVVTLLQEFERQHGYEVIVTIVDDRHLKYFDTKTETWTHLADIPAEHSRGGCKVCCVEGNIYLVGGHFDRRVTEYNPRTNTWRNMPSLQQGRVGHSVCTLDNKIFVLGGGYNNTTCEMLDLSDDDPHWRYIAMMNSKHYGDGAVVIEGKIYVLGGDTNVEVYDVDQDQWRIDTNMSTRRFRPDVAALDNKIYVTGGHDVGGGQRMSRVDCYDPNTNTWSQMTNMNIARYGHSLVSLHGRLYAIGGWGVDSVEVYDPDNKTWTLLQHKLDGKVFGNGDCLIKKYYLQSA